MILTQILEMYYKIIDTGAGHSLINATFHPKNFGNASGKKILHEMPLTKEILNESFR